MPRLGVSIDHVTELKAPAPDKYGRRIRYVSGVEPVREPSRLFDPILVKLAAGLTIVAAVSIAAALWRLFTFPH